MANMANEGKSMTYVLKFVFICIDLLVTDSQNNKPRYKEKRNNPQNHIFFLQVNASKIVFVLYCHQSVMSKCNRISIYKKIRKCLRFMGTQSIL